MKKQFALFGLFLVISGLTACSSMQSGDEATRAAMTTENQGNKQEMTLASSQSGIATNKPANTFTAQTNTPVGGSLTRSMDSVDKTKLSRSLDKSIGKTTEWKNEITGINYAVTPVRKVTIDGNHFCRQYTMTATRGEASQQLTETACIGQDGEWHPA